MLSAAETYVFWRPCSNQSASANALHQPFGLISPSTTLHDLGGSNSVQVAHMRMSFGLSWYSASFCDIFSGAPARDIAPDANQAATLVNPARSSMPQNSPIHHGTFLWHPTPGIAAAQCALLLLRAALLTLLVTKIQAATMRSSEGRGESRSLLDKHLERDSAKRRCGPVFQEPARGSP
jgi:hypothetical protein